MKFNKQRIRNRDIQSLFLFIFFAISLLFPIIAHSYVMFVLPLVFSYFFAPNLAEIVFWAHRGPAFSKRLRSTRKYYRFIVSDMSFLKILEYSLYPFLFFISILLQTGEPSFGYLFEMQAFFTTLSFPFIFLVAAVIWLLDQSGLRYVDDKEQYIERLGNWFSQRFRGFASMFVVVSLVLSILEKGVSLITLQEILWVSVIIYIQVLISTFIFLKFALRRDLERFEEILSKKYKISAERREFSIKKTRFFF